MDAVDRYHLLEELERALREANYDDLRLKHLDQLRAEVQEHKESLIRPRLLVG